jgi:hypothetical protein
LFAELVFSVEEQEFGEKAFSRNQGEAEQAHTHFRHRAHCEARAPQFARAQLAPQQAESKDKVVE